MPYLRHSAVRDARSRPEHLIWHGVVCRDNPFRCRHEPPNGGHATRARHGRRNGFAQDLPGPRGGGIALGDGTFPERFHRALTPALEAGRDAARALRDVEPREPVMPPDLTRMILPDGAEDDLPVEISDEDRRNAECQPGGAIAVIELADPDRRRPRDGRIASLGLP